MSTACLEALEQSVPANKKSARRVLLVSYHFPPVGGAGVQRPVKFVKYLREHGWEASVLIAANPSVPVFDESLCADLPEDLVIARARTWEPDYSAKQKLAQSAGQSQVGIKTAIKGLCRGLVRKAAGVLLQPDPQVLWLPAAYREGSNLLSQLPHDAILATAPPYSNLILGTMLKKRFALPLIVDFRDEWDLSSQYLENSQHDWISRVVQERLQRMVLRNADAIVATTQASTQRLLDRARLAGSSAAAQCIYNGYDTQDFANVAETARSTESQARFRLVYTGTLWNLTSVAPLVEAIELLQRESPGVLKNLELLFVGRKTEAQKELLKRIAPTGCHFEEQDYCDHHSAVELMQSADGLALLLSAVPGADRVAPAKLFEYLATSKPLLSIVPHGETAEIARRFFPEGQFVPEDVAGIAAWIKQQTARRQSGLAAAKPAADVAQFSRRHQAGELAQLLNTLIKQ